MREITFYGYAPDALVFDAATGDVRLSPDFTPGSGRTRFEVSDNDNKFDGDARANETGDDNDQTATVYGPDGSMIGDGLIYVEEVRWYETPNGETFTITVLEIDSVVMGFVPSVPLEQGADYTYTGSTDAGDKPGGSANNHVAQNYNFYEQNSVACFGPGTMIATQNGDIPVEWLDTSDRVLTRDDGFQRILWIGRTRVPAGYFSQYPEECPVRIAAGTLGPNSPTQMLNLTGDHRVLIRAAEAELLFASTEVLAPAKAWADTELSERKEPDGSYVLTHILLASHHVILAQGAWVESLFTGPETMRRLSAENRATLSALLGGELPRMRAARLCLTRKEAVALLLLLPKPHTSAADPERIKHCA